eukprot:2412401-Pyramimonas_sp.AAC.1
MHTTHHITADTVALHTLPVLNLQSWKLRHQWPRSTALLDRGVKYSTACSLKRIEALLGFTRFRYMHIVRSQISKDEKVHPAT